MDKGLLIDGVLADSEAQRRRLWLLREGQAEAQKAGGAGIKHDVSVPVSRVPEFIGRADAALELNALKLLKQAFDPDN